MFTIAVVLALFGSAFCTDASTQVKEAHLVISKTPQSMYAVEHMDFVIEYGIYNTGDKAATKVAFNDLRGFPTQNFHIVKGSLSAQYEKIAPGANVTHSLIVRPTSYGVFNHSAAEVTYFSDGTGDHFLVTSTLPGEGYIYRQKEYERRFSPKYPFWLGFGALVALPTLPAALLFLSSKSKFDELAKKKST